MAGIMKEIKNDGGRAPPKIEKPGTPKITGNRLISFLDMKCPNGREVVPNEILPKYRKQFAREQRWKNISFARGRVFSAEQAVKNAEEYYGTKKREFAQLKKKVWKGTIITGALCGGVTALASLAISGPLTFIVGTIAIVVFVAYTKRKISEVIRGGKILKESKNEVVREQKKVEGEQAALNILSPGSKQPDARPTF